MHESEACLVLEGGAQRGVYTAGVQGVLHNAGIQFPAIIGTSAGAMNGISYLTKQPERSYLINHHFARDKNFMGLRPLLRERQIFSFRYMFGAVNHRFPLDLDAFRSSPVRLIAIASDVARGAPAYLERANCSNMLQALMASASMPMLSTPVSLDGRLYLDGGPTMPFGYQKAIDEGYGKIVLVLTRGKDYRKTPTSPLLRELVRKQFRKYPRFYQALVDAPLRYNHMLHEINRLEAAGRIFVLRPSAPVTVSRTEKDLSKLKDLFLLGRADAREQLAALQTYLHT